MKKPVLIATVILLIAVSFAAGYLFSKPDSGRIAGGERKVLYYVDPMNPGFKSDNPGIAPCGMPLEPVYADTGGSPGSGTPSMPPGTVRISPEKQQLMGLKLATVAKKPGTETIRLLGRVVPDETRTYRINAATDVWVRKVFPPTTGSLVKKDEPLMAYYTSAFLAAANAYLFALDTRDRHTQSSDVSQAQAQNLDYQMRQAVGNLLNMGVSESQMKEMAKTRKTSELVEVRSPSEGFVLTRSVTPGQFVSAGNELYRIADLSRVWILAETYEKEGSFLKTGMKVKVTHPHTNQTFNARVSDILPQFDPQTRTMKVRLETENPGYALRPDMFVDVQIPVNLPSAITVPADAVIDTGLRKTVYVDRGDGNFEPRRVETGWRLAKQVEITGGLMPGEKIVVSANFLIDSESRMRAAAQGIFGSPTKDPVCGMFVDEDKTAAAGRTSKYQGKTYFFCSDPCKADFEKDPKRYAEQGVKEPDARTKEAMMKELGMREDKVTGGAGTGRHDGHGSHDKDMDGGRKAKAQDSHQAPPPAKSTDKKQDKTSKVKPHATEDHRVSKPMDSEKGTQARQTATDKPESLLPPPPGMEMGEGREFNLPGQGK